MPYNWEIYAILGDITFNLGAYTNSEAHLKEAIRLSPGVDFNYFTIAKTLNAMGRYEDAVAYFKEGLNVNPGYIDKEEVFAEALRHTGQSHELVELWLCNMDSEMRQTLSRSLERQSESDIMLPLATAVDRAEDGKYSEAAEHMRTCLKRLQGDDLRDLLEALEDAAAQQTEKC